MKSEFVSVMSRPELLLVLETVLLFFNMDLGNVYNFMEFYAHADNNNLMGRAGIYNSAIESNNLRKYLISNVM